MSRFLKALSKVGLVELDASGAAAPATTDDEAIDLLLHTSGSESPASETAPPPPPPSPAPPTLGQPLSAHGEDSSTEGAAPATTGESGIQEGREFQEIYDAAGVTSSPFPAEKMMKVLEGLAAMDPATRRAAILAMDAADDAWSIEDPIIDARRKIAALDAAQTELKQQVEDAATSAHTALAAQDKYRDEATATIRQQIAELEEVLQNELSTVAVEKANIDAGLKATKGSALREQARLDKEIQRLNQIEATFSAQGEQE